MHLTRLGQRCLRWLGSDRTGVGLDVGTTSVKAVTLTQQAGRCEMVGASLVPLGACADPAAVVDAIRRAVVEAHAEGYPVVAALSAAAVTAQLLDLPIMPEEDLYSVVPYRAQEEMPLDLRQSRFDFTVLSRGERRVRVLAVAAPEEAVERAAALVRRAGLSICAMDVDSLAVVNCFLGMGLAGEGTWARGTIGLLHVGASLTSLAVLTGGELDFRREVVIGMEAAAEMETALEDLANEIRLSLEYHESQSFRRVSCLLLTGGGLAHPRAAGIFEAVLRVPVLPWDPTEALAATPELRERVRPIAPQLTVGIGLALRGLQEL